MTYKKKLIEVALPLEAINIASAREKSIRHGHPSTLHLWWARRPLAAARAVIFAQMVDDPSAHPDIFKTEKAQEKERQRLFRIIEELVKWENTTNETVLQQARDEIWQSWRYTCAENADHPREKELFDRFKLPAFHDPFAGGGALPLEAQRLGLDSYASDLNPVAVLINKAMIEIPPRFAGQPPVNPESRKGSAHSGSWGGAQGLAEDVRYYGKWMRNQAEKRIGHLYPKVDVTPTMVEVRPDLKQYENQKLTVIAWLWARTVKSPNPAFANVNVPLASTFMLSTKAGLEAYVEPVIGDGGYHFAVKGTKPIDVAAARRGTKSASSGSSFLCLMSGTPIPFEYVRVEAKAGRMGARLMAVVAEGDRGRVFLSPTNLLEEQEEVKPAWIPDLDIEPGMSERVVGYGFLTFGDLFTRRQLVALTTFSDLVTEARNLVKQDAVASGLPDDSKSFESLGIGCTAYSEAVGVYLGLGTSKSADYWSSACTWRSDPKNLGIGHVFSKQSIPMAWDFAEGNPFSASSGNYLVSLDWIARVVNQLPCMIGGVAVQADAGRQTLSVGKVVSTDPPYYDNIGYADLSDFFYVWLRRTMKPVFPDLFTTLAVPKAEELVATPNRHGSRAKAEAFFLNGMTQAMHRLTEQSHPAFPVTIYYAFKQTESDGVDGTTNTGWDTFLAAVIDAGFSITGTWPIRTEMGNRMVSVGNNALASSIVLVCRQRDSAAHTATRREFIAALKAELPQALAHLQKGNIAPVDLAQAAIGPGMAVYSRYTKVLDAEGKPLPVRTALALINQTLDEALAEQEGDFDADTRWALTWFDQVGFAEGDYGVAEQLSKSKNTAVAGLVEGGILLSKAGKVRLLKPEELAPDWDPSSDKRLTVWEMLHQLVRVLEASGEGAASVLVAKLGSQAETARELCYRLYTLCERKKRAAEAMAYNGLVQSWPEITRLAREAPRAAPTGTDDMFNQG
jgi:putative DNA methylase